MSKIEKIKAEIERLKNEVSIGLGEYDAGEENGKWQICNNILSFINSLQDEPVNEYLDKVFIDEYSKFSNDTDAGDYAFPIDLADFQDFAKHFFELGLKAQKEQIMKDAIKATVHPEDYELWCDLSQTNLQDGQEVKVIVIKED